MLLDALHQVRPIGYRNGKEVTRHHSKFAIAHDEPIGIQSCASYWYTAAYHIIN